MVHILGKDIGATALGLMGFTWRDKVLPVEEAIEVLKAAVNNGLVFWSGAEIYGTLEYNSMTLVKAYFTKYPEDADKVIISIKGGVDPETQIRDSSAEGTRRSIDRIINALGGVKKLDIWSPTRRDPNVPLEETFKAAQEYIDAGQLGGVALSEVGVETIHEGAKAGKVVLCEVELSLFTPDILRNGIAAACGESGIPILAYSPMSRGILTGHYTDPSQIKGIAAHFPRFQGDNFHRNLALVQTVTALAEKKGCSAAQLAVAWVRAQGGRNGNPEIVPLPGSTTIARLEENAKAVSLGEDEVAELTALAEGFEVAGLRYPEQVPSNT